MRRLSLQLSVALATLLTACSDLTTCSDDTDADLGPLVTRPPLYRVPVACSECSEFTLYRHERGLELRAYTKDHHFIGLEIATMSEATSAELDALLDIDELGAPANHMSFDGLYVQLLLPDVHLGYTLFHPPSALVELDAMLWGLLVDLSECRNSSRLVTAVDCEPLSDYPE